MTDENHSRKLTLKNTALFLAAVSLLASMFSRLLSAMIREILYAPGFGLNFAQNVLFPFIALGLAWGARDRLRNMDARRDWSGFVLTVASAALCAAAWRTEKYVTARYLFVVAFYGLVAGFYGWRLFSRLWAPMLLLALTVPLHLKIQGLILSPGTYIERDLTAKAAVAIMNALGVPTWREGFNLHIPRGVMNIDLTCSGVNYVMSLMVIAIALIYFSHGAAWRRWALVAAAPVAAVTANIVRVIANMLVAHFRGIEAGYRFFHDAGGVVFALAALAVFLAVARALGLTFFTAASANAFDSGVVHESKTKDAK